MKLHVCTTDASIRGRKLFLRSDPSFLLFPSPPPALRENSPFLVHKMVEKRHPGWAKIGKDGLKSGAERGPRVGAASPNRQYIPLPLIPCDGEV